MNVSFEAQNVELSPEWKQQVEDRLVELSDPRDPVISARSTFSYRSGELPPAQVSLLANLRGKNIVVTKRGLNIDTALKSVLDCIKREIRQFYDLRAQRRTRGPTPDEGVAAAAYEPEYDEAELA